MQLFHLTNIVKKYIIINFTRKFKRAASVVYTKIFSHASIPFYDIHF